MHHYPICSTSNLFFLQTVVNWATFSVSFFQMLAMKRREEICCSICGIHAVYDASAAYTVHAVYAVYPVYAVYAAYIVRCVYAVHEKFHPCVVWCIKRVLVTPGPFLFFSWSFLKSDNI